MTKKYISMSIAAMVFGLWIVALSCISVINVQQNKMYTFSEMEFYVDSDILPDHPLYLTRSAIDLIRLSTARSDKEKITLQMQYAVDRLYSSQQLLKKGKKKLAAITLPKAQQYLNQAMDLALNTNDLTQREMNELIKVAAYHRVQVESIKSKIKMVSDHAQIDQLLSNNQILESKLKDIVSQKNI